MSDLADISPYLEGLFLTETLQDWDQTRKFLGDPRYHETNRILGPHPSVEKMTAFGVGMDVAQYASYKALPDSWKFPYTLGSALIEGAVVQNNKRLTGYPWSVPLAGVGAALTAALARDWHNDHIAPFVDLAGKDLKTPIAGVTIKW